MKSSRIILAWWILLPSMASGQDVRVRLSKTRPPEALSVRAVEGEVRWRVCSACAETVGRELAFGAGEENGDTDFFVTGHYELRPASGPIFSGTYPAHIERRSGHLLVTVTIPLEEYVAAELMAESGDFESVFPHVGKFAEWQNARKSFGMLVGPPGFEPGTNGCY